MTDINAVTIIGTLCRDIDVRYTLQGAAIGNLAIAVNRDVKKGNEWVKEADFFDVKVFGKTAENLKQFLTKGKRIGLEGYLRQERWEKDGQKMSKVVINTINLQLLSPKEQSNNAGGYSEDYGYGN